MARRREGGAKRGGKVGANRRGKVGLRGRRAKRGREGVARRREGGAKRGGKVGPGGGEGGAEREEG